MLFHKNNNISAKGGLPCCRKKGRHSARHAASPPHQRCSRTCTQAQAAVASRGGRVHRTGPCVNGCWASAAQTAQSPIPWCWQGSSTLHCIRTSGIVSGSTARCRQQRRRRRSARANERRYVTCCCWCCGHAASRKKTNSQENAAPRSASPATGSVHAAVPEARPRHARVHARARTAPQQAVPPPPAKGALWGQGTAGLSSSLPAQPSPAQPRGAGRGEAASGHAAGPGRGPFSSAP